MKRLLILLALAGFTRVQAQSNFALNFNGTNQYVTIGSPIATGSSYTKEAWVFATSGTGPRNIISSTDAPLWLNSGTLQAGHGGSFSLVSDPTTFPLNRWVHVAVTYNSATTTMVLYRDGVAVSTNNSVPSYTSEPTFIGSHTGGLSYFQGNIDEVRIWSTALSATQLKQRIYSGPSKLSAGLVRLYKFNEGSGTSLVDSTSTLDGTLVNSPTWVASPIQASNNSINFDGSNDNIAIPNTISGSFTLEYWINTTATGGSGTQWYNGNGIVDGEVGGVANDWGTSLNGSNLAFGIGNPDLTIFSTSAVNTGSWTHVAVSWDQTTGDMRLYINGIEEASGSASTSLRSAPPRISLGQLQTNINFFNGSLDEVRIWNIVRTSTQIMANMNAELNPSAEANLVAYYTFNQGITSGTNTGISVLMDMKNTNNGSMNNFALSGSTSNFVAQFASITPLPLRWLDFTVASLQGKALLQWISAREQNTAYFDLQHSSDGISWQSIGQVPSNNRPDEESTYCFLHNEPKLGTNYYRIRQNDLDGQFSYSSIRSLQLQTSQHRLQVVNPILNGQLNLYGRQQETIELYDSFGRVVLRTLIQSGGNTYDLSSLPRGIYLLKSTSETIKISLL